MGKEQRKKAPWRGGPAAAIFFRLAVLCLVLWLVTSSPSSPLGAPIPAGACGFLSCHLSTCDSSGCVSALMNNRIAGYGIQQPRALFLHRLFYLIVLISSDRHTLFLSLSLSLSSSCQCLGLDCPAAAQAVFGIGTRCRALLAPLATPASLPRRLGPLFLLAQSLAVFVSSSQCRIQSLRHRHEPELAFTPLPRNNFKVYFQA